MRMSLWKVSSYLREDAARPEKETHEIFIGLVVADIHNLPFRDDADVHVEFYRNVSTSQYWVL